MGSGIERLDAVAQVIAEANSRLTSPRAVSQLTAPPSLRLHELES